MLALAPAASVSGSSSFTRGLRAHRRGIERDLLLLCRFLEEGVLAVEDQDDLREL